MAACKASSASTEQCSFTGGSPPSDSVTISLVICKASSTVLPITISVARLEVAMAAPQPKVLNFTSVMTSLSSTLMYIFMMSPHLALPTSPTPLASSISPTLRGFMK